MAGLGKGLTICSTCGNSNSDQFTVTSKTVNNKNDSIVDANNDPNEGCGRARACVKPRTESPSSGPGVHMGKMYMVFEDPPWSAAEEVDAMGMKTGNWVPIEYLWTSNMNLNGEPVRYIANREVLYVFVDRIMLHEFGHTLGLHDFYGDPTMDHFDAIMNTSYEIQDEDIAQLEAIYFHHSPH